MKPPWLRRSGPPSLPARRRMATQKKDALSARATRRQLSPAPRTGPLRPYSAPSRAPLANPRSAYHSSRAPTQPWHAPQPAHNSSTAQRGTARRGEAGGAPTLRSTAASRGHSSVPHAASMPPAVAQAHSAAASASIAQAGTPKTPAAEPGGSARSRGQPRAAPQLMARRTDQRSAYRTA